MGGEKEEDKHVEYSTAMPWPSIPFLEDRFKKLLSKFSVKSYPSFVVINASDCSVIQAQCIKDFTEFGPQKIEELLEKA